MLKILSSKTYNDASKNYGDCIIIYDNDKCIVYDCGSEEHAKRVLKFLEDNNITTIDIVLSHNDADHFNGILVLLQSGKVKKVYTLLVLKYIDKLLAKIDDNRKTRDSIKQQIIETYDNIYQLKNHNCELVDAIEATKISEHVKCVGPSEDYFIEATAKLFNTQESDQIDSETICNATSIQLEIIIGENKMLLTGDSNFTAIEDKIKQYNLIQLPHHGKKEQAEQIFQKNKNNHRVRYYISDNTGNSNGGSNNLNTQGHIVKNTKYDGDITIDINTSIAVHNGYYGL